MNVADEITRRHYFQWVTVESGVDDNGTPYGTNEGRCACGHRLASESFSHHVATVTALLLADVLDNTAKVVAEHHGTGPRGMFETAIDGAVVSGIEIATRAIRAMVEGDS